MTFFRWWVFFGGVLAVVFLGWAGLVGSAQLQIAAVPPQPGLRPYTFEEAHGREVYIREGCMYCHSQQTRPVGFGADQQRLWGRPAAPGDYFYDQPHLLGTMRTGPDLLNIGARQASLSWHLPHLYNPRLVVAGSLMPPFPWLFEEKASTGPEDTLVEVAGKKNLVAGREALDLCRYLVSMNRTYPVR